MFHMVRAVPRMATMRAASLKAQTIMAARVAPTMVTPARVSLSLIWLCLEGKNSGTKLYFHNREMNASAGYSWSEQQKF